MFQQQLIIYEPKSIHYSHSMHLDRQTTFLPVHPLTWLNS